MHASPDGTVEMASRNRLVNFASNDYLGLADDPILREAAKAAIDEYGVGAGASRLVSGTRPGAYRNWRKKLARFKGAEAALTFSSGYADGVGSHRRAGRSAHDVLILDKLCHACLVDAARASRRDSARVSAQRAQRNWKTIWHLGANANIPTRGSSSSRRRCSAWTATARRWPEIVELKDPPQRAPAPRRGARGRRRSASTDAGSPHELGLAEKSIDILKWAR